MESIHLFALPPLVSGTIIFSIGVFVLIKNFSSPIHRALTYFCFSLAIWHIGYSLMYLEKQNELALQFAKIAFIGMAFTALTNFNFNLAIIKSTQKKYLQIFLVTITSLFAITAASDLIFTNTKLFFWGRYPQAGILFPAFILFYIITWTYGLYLLYHKMSECKAQNDFLSYNQIKYVFIAGLGGLFGVIDFIPKFGIPIYPFSYLIALYWTLICTISLIYYRTLPDIYFITRRVLITSCFIGLLTCIYAFLFTIRSITKKWNILIDNQMVLMSLSVISGILFLPIYQKVKNEIDKHFFSEYFHRKETLIKLRDQIIASRNSSEFTRIILSNIHSLFKIIKSSLFVLDDVSKEYVLVSKTGWGLNLNDPSPLRFEKNHPIPFTLNQQTHIEFRKIPKDLEHREIVRSMIEYNASLAIPITIENELKGFYLFDEKESGLPYSSEDIRSLKILAEHSTTGIERMQLSTKWNKLIKQNEHITSILQQYLNPSIANAILQGNNNLQTMEGQKKYVTVLFSDLRGFTQLSEKYPPEMVAEYLNGFFSEMTKVIQHYKGSIDKFIGDSILVVFGMLHPMENSEYVASRCALKMQRCLSRYNEQRRQKNLFTLDMGIGISAGDVIAGNIGSNKQMQYTVIGDAVNTAARIQGFAKKKQILASANIIEKIKGKLSYKKEGTVTAKGKKIPIQLIEIKGLILKKQNILQ